MISDKARTKRVLVERAFAQAQEAYNLAGVLYANACIAYSNGEIPEVPIVWASK